MRHEVVILARDDPYLAARAGAIRALGKRMARDIIEIGRLLANARNASDTAPGCRGWSANSDGQIGRRATSCQPHAMMISKSETVSDLNIDARSLYALARPSTPDELRDELRARCAAVGIFRNRTFGPICQAASPRFLPRPRPEDAAPVDARLARASLSD